MDTVVKPNYCIQSHMIDVSQYNIHKTMNLFMAEETAMAWLSINMKASSEVYFSSNKLMSSNIKSLYNYVF